MEALPASWQGVTAGRGIGLRLARPAEVHRFKSPVHHRRQRMASAFETVPNVLPERAAQRIHRRKHGGVAAILARCGGGALVRTPTPRPRRQRQNPGGGGPRSRQLGCPLQHLRSRRRQQRSRRLRSGRRGDGRTKRQPRTLSLVSRQRRRLWLHPARPRPGESPARPMPKGTVHLLRHTETLSARPERC